MNSQYEYDNVNPYVGTWEGLINFWNYYFYPMKTQRPPDLGKKQKSRRNKNLGGKVLVAVITSWFCKIIKQWYKTYPFLFKMF